MPIDFISQFNNRELAITIWLIILVGWLGSSSKVRPSVINLVKAFIAWKLIIGYMAMGIYITIVLVVLKCFGIWSKTSTATILIWIICVAFVMLFKADKENKYDFFKIKAKENLRFLVVIEFIINFYAMDIWLELLFVPLMAVLGVILAIVERDSKYEPLHKLLNGFIFIIGVLFMGYAFIMIVVDFKSFASISTLENFVLPILLTLFFLPFVYMVAVYATYEILFIRLKYIIKNPLLFKYAKMRTFQVFHFRLAALDEWSKNIYILNIVDRQSVDEALRNMNKVIANKKAAIA